MKKVNLIKNTALYHITYVLADIACLIGNTLVLKRRFRSSDESLHKTGICDYRRIFILDEEKPALAFQFGK